METPELGICEDLAGLFRGEIRDDPLGRAIYASDASLYQVTPQAVCCPQDADDLAVLVKYAREERLPLFARGAGSGLAGESLGRGLVVDFSRHMHEVLSFGEQTVRVQPGVVLEGLNERLRPLGRYFPPDPSGSAVTTIGGMLGVDAAGSHSIRVGSTRDHVQSLEVVLASGLRFEAGVETVPARLTEINEEFEGRPEAVRAWLLSRLSHLLAANAEMIQERQSARQFRNRSGYFLRGVLSDGTINLPRLLVGSEGTLGLITAATLHTSPLPACRGVILLLYPSVDSAAVAVRHLVHEEPSACDLLDRRILTLACEIDEQLARAVPPSTEAALIVEQTGGNEEDVLRRLERLVAAQQEIAVPGQLVWRAVGDREVERLWGIAHRVVPLLNRLRGETRPLPFVEDIAVPPESLQEFLHRAQRVLHRHQAVASLYAHAAAGQVHLRPFLANPTPASASKLEELARDLYESALALGGSLSGEHGLGLARTAFLRSQYGPLYRVFEQIKRLFDPENLLNPGKVISDDPHLTVRHFRPADGPQLPLHQVQLEWSPVELKEQAARCNGCGACRTQAPEGRMCPFFRTEPDEERSPRAKANVMRWLADGMLPATVLDQPEMERLTRTCFNCKQCELECPTNVNVPHLMLEAKAQRVAAHGLSRIDWFLSRLHTWGNFGCRVSPAINLLLQTRLGRWLLEKSVQIARQRKLPRFARRPFLQTARRKWLMPPASFAAPRPVIYFVDHYANYHDPDLAEAFCRIVEHQGLRVHVPPGQRPSGMALISAGDVEAARPLAEHNIRTLVEFAREGCPIVCTEPTAAVCLRQDYPRILNDGEAGLVAGQVIEAGEFLRQIDQQGNLRRNFSVLSMSAAYHAPCHLKALGAGEPLADLCDLIPGLEISRIEHGCSGMAGVFGLSKANLAESLAIGHDLIERMATDRFGVGMTECSACKMQMEQRTTRPTVHPLKLLALAYGLMPELQRALQPSSNRRVIS